MQAVKSNHSSEGQFFLSHIPVMLEEVKRLIVPRLLPGDVFIDATLGAGGHSEAILTSAPGAFLIGIDRDSDAIALAQKRLTPFAQRCTFIHNTFDVFDKHLSGLQPKAFLFDLGVSSMQIDNPGRGFSYTKSGAVDMRMDLRQAKDAKEILNSYSENSLIRIFREFGQERYSKRIARKICQARSVGELTTTCEVAQLIKDAYPAGARKGHPAKRVFQALRIEVNNELSILRAALNKAIPLLQPGGVIVALSYHSLEDRIVKHAFRNVSVDQTPRDFPYNILSQRRPEYRLVGRELKNPKQVEIANNPRSKSVHLRAIERVSGSNSSDTGSVD